MKKISIGLVALVPAFIIGLASAADSTQRARPGAVQGAVMMSTARMPSLWTNNCPGCVGPSVNPPVIPPVVPPVEPPVTPPETDPCKIVLPELGTDICTARRACTGISADGHVGVFDEATRECCVPVVAHNWSGIIKKSGEDVWSCVPFGQMVKCDANLFDQISAMRRTSQWVIPTMIVGGAGIGAGIGAIVDHNNAKKETQREQAAFEAGRAGAEAHASASADVAAALAALNLTQDDLNNAIAGAKNNIKKCAAEAFTELVSPNFGTGNDNVCKLGRIKILATGDCSENSDNSNKNTTTTGVPYCSYNYVHATDAAGRTQKGIASNADTGWANCNGTENAYVQCPTVTFASVGSGTCYYRDEVTGTNADAGKYQKGNRPNIFALNEDSTASFDLHRANMLSALGQAVAGDSDFAALASAIGKIHIDNGNKSAEVEAGGNQNPNSMDYVKITTDAPFAQIQSEMLTGVNMTTGSCQQVAGDIFKGTKLEGVFGSSESNTIENMGDIAGYLQGLGYSADAITTLSGNLNIILSAKASVQFTYADFDAWQAANPADRKGFFQKAIGKGLLIGTGIGALGGLGYWFAEGASVFCNVGGGFDQLKLGKTMSLPSFREWLIQKGFGTY